MYVMYILVDLDGSNSGVIMARNIMRENHLFKQNWEIFLSFNQL